MCVCCCLFLGSLHVDVCVLRTVLMCVMMFVIVESFVCCDCYCWFSVLMFVMMFVFWVPSRFVLSLCMRCLARVTCCAAVSFSLPSLQMGAGMAMLPVIKTYPTEYSQKNIAVCVSKPFSTSTIAAASV